MYENGYIDKSLVQNTTLSCLLLTYFIKKYKNISYIEDSPDLLKILLVLPLVWHKESCILINKRNKKTSFYELIAEDSIIKVDFEKRLLDFYPITIQGLNLALSTGLIEKLEDDEKVLFNPRFKRWSKDYSIKVAPSDMINALNRISFWFKNYSTAELYLILLGD